jgi:hypothetical protein
LLFSTRHCFSFLANDYIIDQFDFDFNSAKISLKTNHISWTICTPLTSDVTPHTIYFDIRAGEVFNMCAKHRLEFLLGENMCYQ